MYNKHTNYEIIHVVCVKCGAYMTMHHIFSTHKGIIITYYCNCGNTISYASLIENKKDDE